MLLGAVHDTVAEPSALTADTPVGAPETVATGVTDADELDATLLPQPAVQLGAVRTAMLRLNQLLPMQKQTLIKALTLCVTSDARIEPLEADILRAVYASLDVPLPQPIS